MYYSLEQVREAHQKNEKLKYLLFWGHTPAKDGGVTAACLSQWWLCSFTIDDVTYTSAEQYMMAGKSRLFGDDEVFAEIIKTRSPKEVKALGRKVRNFDENLWKQSRFDIVVAGNLAKFSQNPELKAFLLSTRGKILVEASPYDRIWGIGMGKENEFAENPMKWRGQNLLGFALTKVRDTLGS